MILQHELRSLPEPMLLRRHLPNARSFAASTQAMARHTYAKRKVEVPAVGDEGVAETTRTMLEEIEAGGEARAHLYSKELDGFTGTVDDVVVSEKEMQQAEAELPEQLKYDLKLAYENIRAFAEAQRASIKDLESAPGLWPGMVAGHRMVPLDCAGC